MSLSASQRRKLATCGAIEVAETKANTRFEQLLQASQKRGPSFAFFDGRKAAPALPVQRTLFPFPSSDLGTQKTYLCRILAGRKWSEAPGKEKKREKEQEDEGDATFLFFFC